jgi:hypothetical protein
MGQKQESGHSHGMSQDSQRRHELEQLDKADLIEGYLLLEKRLATLEGQVNAFKQALGIKPDKTPANSSIPPSQGQKANLKPKKKVKRGPKKGHA